MVQVLRRQVLIAAGALFASPLVAEGQSPITRQRIAYLASDSLLSSACVSDSPDVSLDAFLDGLRVLGYVGEQSVALECRSAQSDTGRSLRVPIRDSGNISAHFAAASRHLLRNSALRRD